MTTNKAKSDLEPWNMNKTKLSIIGILSLLLVGCVGLHSGVKTNVDRFQGTVTKSVAIMVARDLSVTILQVRKDTQVGYSLGVSYIDTDWMFIESGESCIILADGARFPLKGDGSAAFRETAGGPVVKETAWYVLVPREMLAKIANARQASLKVYGTKRSCEGRFTDGARKAIQKFLAETEATAPSAN